MSLLNLKQAIEKYNNNSKFEKFEDIVSTNSQLKREIYIGVVDSDIAENMECLVRFWNMLDDEENIPVEEREPIKVFINSPGGSLISCFTIIDTIRLSKTPIWTINIGAAYSAGFFIFICGHKRFAYPNATFLFHEGSTGGDDGYVDAHKFRNHADFYSKQLEKLKNHVLTFTKLTEAEYQAVKKDDYWLFVNEAIEKGMCDEIMEEFV